MKSKIYRNYFDIVILPPREVSDYAIALSRDLRRRGGKWALGKTRFIPHISLYHIPVKPENFAAFMAAPEQTVRAGRAGRLRTTGVESNLLMFDKPEWLSRLYLRVIKRTVPYFDWDYGVERLWHVAGDKREISKRKYLEKYGTPMVGLDFRPHVTLTVFKDKELKGRNFPGLKFKRLSFAVEKLSVCELGPSHSCQRVVQEVRF